MSFPIPPVAVPIHVPVVSTYYTYGPLGRVQTIKDGKGYQTTVEYDAEETVVEGGGRADFSPPDAGECAGVIDVAAARLGYLSRTAIQQGKSRLPAWAATLQPLARARGLALAGRWP